MESPGQLGGSLLRALALACALVGTLSSVACNEANGTEPWPDVYVPESQLDRPKGEKKDAGAAGDASGMDANAGDGSALDAAASDAAVPEDASAMDTGVADAAMDGAAAIDAAVDGGAQEAALMDVSPQG